jgi:predicted acylesterase/phospholipase RssA
VIMVGLTSCISPKIYNEGDKFKSSNETFPASSYNFLNWIEHEHKPRLAPDLIIVTLSGGGIRASALASATIEELRKFTINGRPLTDNIVMISSTSGGSIAAGYIAAHGFGHYADFRRDFLVKANTRDLIVSGLGPRLFYDRSSLMREFLESRFSLNGISFGDLLARADRPFFIFNATDLSGGRQFRFLQSDFNLICTNLSNLPVSVGVTASSAIPFLLTDVEFKNRWDSCPLEMDAIANLDVFNFSAGNSTEMHYRYNLVHAYDNNSPLKERGRPIYLHLADGGLVDNLGSGGSSQADIDMGSSLSDAIGGSTERSNIRQVLIIEINARSDKKKESLDATSGSPGLFAMMNLSISIPIDRATALTSGVVRDYFQGTDSIAPYVNSGIFVAQIDFDLLPDGEEVLREKVKQINTGLTLKENELTAIERASFLLLRQNPCLARFVAQSGAVAENYVLSNPKGEHTGAPYDCRSLLEPGG